LVCVGADDQVARSAAAIAAARRALHGELRVDPGVDHFDMYDGPEHELVERPALFPGFHNKV